MARSQILVAPGVRTGARHGWRIAIPAAVAVVLARPALWVLGAAGFMARGGALVIVLPVLTLPTAAEWSGLLGANMTSLGPAPAFRTAAAAVAAVLAVLVMAALFLAALVEVAAYEAVMNDPETDDLRRTRRAATLDGGARRGLVAALVLVNTAALCIVCVAALPLVARSVEVGLREVTAPSQTGTPIYLRIVHGARDPLALLLLAIVFADALAATASRWLLARAFRLGRHASHGLRRSSVHVRVALGGAVRLVATIVRVAAASALGWAVTATILCGVLWAELTAWSAVRETLLGASALDVPRGVLSGLVVTGVFAAVFAAGIALTGFASALRAAVWTALSIDSHDS